MPHDSLRHVLQYRVHETIKKDRDWRTQTLHLLLAD